MSLKDFLKGGNGPPPSVGDDFGVFIREPRPKLTLICPGCGDVTTVDAERYCAGTIFAGSAPPACTRCGLIYEIQR